MTVEPIGTGLREMEELPKMKSVHREVSRKRVNLIFTELDLVETFLRISRSAPTWETRQRNRRHAQEAYEVARRYASRLEVGADLKRAIRERLAEIEQTLEAAEKV